MDLSNNTQSTLLLTSRFGNSDRDAAKPLTPTEWAFFASWLKGESLTPGELLLEEPRAHLEKFEHDKIPVSRIIALLDRGIELSIAMEKW